MTVATKSPVTTYAESVLAGDILVGKLVRLACERHLRDLEHGHERGLWFDDEAADRVIKFFGLLQHHKGEWAGQPIVLEPWQQFMVGCMFGWKQGDGTRRFRIAYDEMGRKNGKSTLAAGVGLYLAFFDMEPGAEVYAAATKRDQARIVWGEAKATVQKTAGLRKVVTALAGNLHAKSTGSKFEPLGADKDTMDGLNIHGAIVDELHAHKTRGMWDVLRTATGSRRQPLLFVITTAGYDRNSICWQQHDYGVKVLEGVIEDDAYFAYIATVDDDDEWADESCWIKANPNLGVSVKLDTIRQECREAQEMPGQQNAFRRLRLCQWTEQADRWIDVTVWDDAEPRWDPEDLEGLPCWAGLDMSTTTDLTSLVLAFPREEGIDLLAYNWVPGDNMQRRADRDRVPYPVWAEQGHIEVTEGNVVDYDLVRQRINELGRRFNLREIAIDRWNSTQLQVQLQGDGFTVVPFGQGFASMSAPTKEVERLMLERKLRHGRDPVLRWAASNVAVMHDPAGNIKPAKDKSTERIDPMVAAIMAVGRAMVAETDGTSYYEDGDLFII